MRSLWWISDSGIWPLCKHLTAPPRQWSWVMKRHEMTMCPAAGHSNVCALVIWCLQPGSCGQALWSWQRWPTFLTSVQYWKGRYLWTCQLEPEPLVNQKAESFVLALNLAQLIWITEGALSFAVFHILQQNEMQTCKCWGYDRSQRSHGTVLAPPALCMG